LASKVKATTTTAAPTTNGNLPKGWRMVRFGEVVRDVNEAERSPLDAGLERFVGLEHIEPENLHLKQWGLLADGEISFTKRFRKGQVLFGKRRAYQRKVAVAEFDGICSSDILTFEPKGDVLSPALLPFIVQSEGFLEHALGTSSGSLSPRTRWSQLQDYEFPLPPKDEQRRIAEILWAADESVESRLRVLRSIGAAWQGLIDIIVPDPSAAPAARLSRLGDLCVMQNGRPFPSSNYSDAGFKLLRPGNLAPNGRLIWPHGATVFLDAKFADENGDWIIRPGDVVINLTAQSLEEGFMGRVCLAAAGDESLLNQRLGRFIVKSGTEREYVFRILQTSRFRHVVESHCEGSKVRHTYFRHFANLPVVLLSQEEQQRVIKAGRDVDQARESASQAVDKAQALFATLREHLLGGDS
jgi:type I restriction enzyme S subunit